MGDTIHTPQERYSALVLAKLRRQLVLKEGVVFNTKYEGNPTAGAVKIPVRDTEVKVRAYDKANGIAGAMGSTSYLTVTVEHDDAVNEIIDGYDAASVPDNLIADRLDSAAYTLAEGEDADAGAVLVQGGTLKTCSAEPSEENIYKLIVAAKTALSKAKVPNDNRRYLLATPETMALILTSKQFTDASSLGDEVKQSGIVGRIAGFNVIEWLPGSFDPDEEANYDGLVFIVGHPDFATKVREFSVPVYLADLKNSDKYIGACAVKGRSVYTHKVLRPECILTYMYSGEDEEDEENS